MQHRLSNTHSSARQQDPPTGGYFFLLPHTLSQSKQLIDEQPCVCVTVGEEHTHTHDAAPGRNCQSTIWDKQINRKSKE